MAETEAGPAGALRRLAARDPELALLARLTALGLKPLSRYEAALTEPEVGALTDLGLVAVGNRRQLLDGGARGEWVFSRDPALIERYRQAFADAPIAIDRAGAALEGQLFGFPPCCVASFIDGGYRKNDLSPADQAELFHWACPGCTHSQALVGQYAAIRRELEEGQGWPSSTRAFTSTQ